MIFSNCKKCNKLPSSSKASIRNVNRWIIPGMIYSGSGSYPCYLYLKNYFFKSHFITNQKEESTAETRNYLTFFSRVLHYCTTVQNPDYNFFTNKSKEYLVFINLIVKKQFFFSHNKSARTVLFIGP